MKLRVCLAVVAFSLGARTASATAIYMELTEDGGNPVVGGVTSEAHKGQLELYSTSHGVSTVSATTSKATGAAISKPALDQQEVVVTMALDRAFPPLIAHLSGYKPFAKAIITQYTSAKSADTDVARMTLENAYVTSVGYTYGGDSTPIVTIGLRYTKLTLEWTGKNDENKNMAGSTKAVIEGQK